MTIAGPRDIDVARAEIGLDLARRGIRETGDVVVDRHRRSDGLVVAGQPLVENVVVRVGVALGRQLEPLHDRRTGREIVLLQNERAARARRIVLVDQNVEIAAAIKTEAGIGDLLIYGDGRGRCSDRSGMVRLVH